ncbi:MAG: hypothetical protein KF843_08685 [Flavobacteriales bacterium]|nr:hypothetical protein [Flavobacteriales bacterium]
MASTTAQATTCANAIVINPASLPITNQALVCGTGNEMNATTVPGAICGSGSSEFYKGGREALYSFTPTTSASYQLSYAGQSWSAAMVYIGCPTLNNCLYGSGQTGTAVSFSVTLTAGVTYFIWFDTWPSPASPCPGTFSLGPPPPPITNDNPCQATGLTVNPTLVCTSQTPGSLVGATATTGVTSPCGGTPNDDVWFKFTATGPTHHISLNNIAGSTTDLFHAVFSGPNCNSLTNVSCSDPNSSIVTGLITGNTYWVRVYSWSSSNGATSTFNVCVGTPPPPPPPPACGGTFHDNGGATGSYQANSNETTTICPATPGDMVSLIFTQFDLETNYDQLRIYDGNSTAGALMGTFTGNALPPVLTASNPSGCLTVVFTSDGSVQYAGWAAQVLCGPMPAGDCVYALHLHDSGGNGWGTSSVGVRINGGPYTYHTVTASDNIIFIGVNLGDLIELNYVATGPNQGQNSYSISKLGQNPYFTSSTPPAAGIIFSQIVTCGPPPAQPQDCVGGITLCSSQSITNSSGSTGDVMDLNSTNQGCLSSGERQGTWYYFSPQTAGNIGFSITPANGNDDYDFALWGPYASAQCPTGPPLRCSYNAPPSYTVGLGNGATDFTEGAGGDGWVSTINVQADDVYVLYIDNFSTTGQAFTLNWQLTNTSLDCTTLPVELISLEATARKPEIDVTWTTATEQNSSHFIVERSPDNGTFTPIGTMAAAGNTQFRRDYHFVDVAPHKGVNYYRLQQVDLDGTTEQTHTVTAMLNEDGGKPTIYPNPANEILNVAFNSPLDGTVVLMVEDALGRTIAQSTTVALRGEHKAEVPLTGLAKGWYNLRIALPDGSVLQGGGFLKK